MAARRKSPKTKRDQRRQICVKSDSRERSRLYCAKKYEFCNIDTARTGMILPAAITVLFTSSFSALSFSFIPQEPHLYLWRFLHGSAQLFVLLQRAHVLCIFLGRKGGHVGMFTRG
ncbi:hypothetical protein QBC34DRAFT_8257 [Podospora aff. communis PSN243]|uniref:Transmembrane protein n=1 Tax=Podospora aff. communis PSN243 TaxID=3040156 RepID=A0AAV9H7K8_9PEZI|nr:hypothetical protein QBC34DRAFT_8257 [Podospora aff. communis PSN243]